MKAIGFKQSLPISEEESFIEFEIEKPAPSGYDLLVQLSAISVNPIDFKMRQNSIKGTVVDTPKIIGWDAVGTVEAIGEKVTKFQVGDRVYYAGDVNRSGSNAEYQLVDERIVGRKPATLTDAQAAAMPLTGLTAWEAIFDRLKLHPQNDQGKRILILAGAGGVGSIAIQIAKRVVGLTVIATASRPESEQWCKQLGADYVVNHYTLMDDLARIGHTEVDYIFDCVDIHRYWNTAVDIIKPQGHIVSITGTSSNEPLPLTLLKNKSVSFSWELMFTRPMYATDDMERQHHILNSIADLLDKGILVSTLHTSLTGFTVENLKQAHSLQESGKTIGKIVITY